MPANGAPGAAAPAAAPDAGAGRGDTPTLPAGADWRSTLPPELRDAPSIAKFADPAALAKSYTELEKMRGRFKDEALAEIRAGVPEAPDGYEVKADGLPDGVVWLNEVPADFKPEPGKAYFVANPNDPAVGALKAWAHEQGVKPEGFAKLMGIAAQAMAVKVPSEAEREAQRSEFFASLGENGTTRAGHLYGQLRAKLPEAHVAALDAAVGNKAMFEAVEALVHAAGGARFATGGVAGPTGQVTESQLKEMMRDPRYRDPIRRDPEWVAKVDAGWRQLYPDPLPASHTGRGM